MRYINPRQSQYMKKQTLTAKPLQLAIMLDIMLDRMSDRQPVRLERGCMADSLESWLEYTLAHMTEQP